MNCKMRPTKLVLLLLCTLYSTIHAQDQKFGARFQFKLDAYEIPEPNMFVGAYITICLDTEDGIDTLTECAYRNFTVTWRRNVFTCLEKGFTCHEFWRPTENFHNPLSFGWDPRKVGLKIKMHVERMTWDRELHGVEYPSAKIAVTPYPSYKNASYHNGTSRSEYFGSLSFSFMIYCEPDYYGDDCGRYCVRDKNAEIPYSCDPKTGEKIYQSGRETENKECPKCKFGIKNISSFIIALVLIIVTLMFVILVSTRVCSC